jgi:hypothetical protein
VLERTRTGEDVLVLIGVLFLWVAVMVFVIAACRAAARGDAANAAAEPYRSPQVVRVPAARWRSHAA